MKKMIILAIAATISTLSSVFAGTMSNDLPSSPLRLSFWPKIWTWPSDNNIYGISIGVPASYSSPKKAYVAGIDCALLFTLNNTKGIQFAPLNMGEHSDGVQAGFVNANVKDFAGFQFGGVNQYEKSSGFQLGIINQSSNSTGLQIGILNFMDNGIFPILPLFNYNFNKLPPADTK